MGFQLGAAFLGTIASFRDECISTGCAPKSAGVLQHMLIQENLGTPLLRFGL